MHLFRVNIEVTNICGLACSFCPPKTQPPKTMPLELFENTLKQLRGYTKNLAFHLMGDPMTLSNLGAYLELAHENGFKVELTTSGFYLKAVGLETLMHPAVRQINISLNSFNKNLRKISFEEYLEAVLQLCEMKQFYRPNMFINLRLWNLDTFGSDAEFNSLVIERLSSYFGVLIQPAEMGQNHSTSVRLAPKTLLHFNHYFEWPSLDNAVAGHGTCQGLQSHIGILSDGRVVPCCLDAEGVMALGNVNKTPLDEILRSFRAVAIIEGFKRSEAVEELCQKCTYKMRFDDTQFNRVS